AAAPMHRHAGRLVEHDEPVVLMHDAPADRVDEAGRNACRSRPGLDADWRHPDLVVDLQPLLRARPAAVDAHLALADQAVDAAPGHVLEQLLQEFVETQPGLLRPYLDVPHPLVDRTALLLRHLDLCAIA